MTPKEKAKELIKRFNFNCKECDNAKLCALVAVDEIKDAVMYLDDDSEDFWFEVKQEIEKL